MNFNYRDFFIHNDDLHIIKEQLSIVDEVNVSKKDALSSNAKAVWYAHHTDKKNEKTIADELNINLSTVQEIILICLMSKDENKNPRTIAREFNTTDATVQNVLNNALGSERERDNDNHFTNDAVKIYNHRKNEKTPDEIVDLVNNEKKEHFEKITVEDVKLVLKIVDMAENQMLNKGVLNIAKIAQKILEEFGKKISRSTITNLITTLNLGTIKYQHRFTEEQDAFILHLYLQKNGTTEIARKFNEEFKDSKGNALNILHTSILWRLRNVILKPKGESETHYVSDLLNKYKTKYFSKVNINDPKLTRYIPPERIKGRDTTGTGTNRDMSAHLGTLPKNFNTMITNLVR